MTVSKQRSSENGQQVSLKRFQTTFGVTTVSWLIPHRFLAGQIGNLIQQIKHLIRSEIIVRLLIC